MSVSNSEGDQWLAQEFTRQIVAAVSEAKGSELLDLLVRTIKATVQAEVLRFDAQATTTSQAHTENLARVQEALAGRLQALERHLGGQAQSINGLLPFLEHIVQQIQELNVKQTRQVDAASNEVTALIQPELHRISAALLDLQKSDGKAQSPRTVSFTAADLEKISVRVGEIVVQGLDEQYRSEQTASRASQSPTSNKSKQEGAVAPSSNTATQPAVTSVRHSLFGGSSRWTSFGIVALAAFALGWGAHSGTSRTKAEPDDQKPPSAVAPVEKAKPPSAAAAPTQTQQDHQAEVRAQQKRDEAAAQAVPPLGTAAAIDDAIRRLADTPFVGGTCKVAVEPKTVRTCLLPNAAGNEHATESAASLRKYLAGSEKQDQQRRLAIALFQALAQTLGDGQVRVDGQWGERTKAAIDGIKCAKTTEHTQLIRSSDTAAFGRAIEAVLLNCADMVTKR